MLDNKVLEMNPGEALLEAPIGDLIQKIGASIAEAQLRLDQVGVNVATVLNETVVDFKKEDGKAEKKSLLQLGFAPTFYQFTETEIEVSMTISLKVEEAVNVSGEASLGRSNKGNTAVAFGATISADYHRRYEFDMTGASKVKTKLVSVPPPAVFIDTIKDYARSGGTISAGPKG